MSDFHGQFVWYELMTSDLKAAEDFYRTVVGWRTTETGMSPPYTLLNAGEAQIGGMMAVPQSAAEMGAKPAWLGYVAVHDVDDYAARFKEAGGAVYRAADEIPGVGRFAVVADPQGAAIVLFKGASEPPPAAAAPGGPGQVGWRELMAGDGATAFDFYSKMFGWTKDRPFDMGEMGVYQLFAAGGDAIGGMMTKPAASPGPPHWQYYFNVESVDAAIERIKASGGQVLMGPNQVPTGQWIVQAFDPQGAFFALVGPR